MGFWVLCGVCRCRHGSFNLCINFSKINKYQLPRTKIKISFQLISFSLGKRSCATLEFSFWFGVWAPKSSTKKGWESGIRVHMKLYVNQSTCGSHF